MAEDNENTIFIGKKDTKSYVLAVITQLNQGSTTIVLKARGRSISKAVDVAEMVNNKFAKDLKIKDINTSTEEVSNEDGSKLRVSAIEIIMKKDE
jgi:archaea-specific DNA-binding protein